MDREAFRNRMQQLKQYREQNPGKTYLDWKNSLPSNLQDESNYNLRRAYELGYEPEWNEDDKSYHLFNQAKTMYPNMTRDMYNNILQGTEIKSYMNQFRNYLDQKGKLNRGNYTGSYKNLKKEIIDAPRESFNNIKAIFNLYRSPKLFNKDFQMIPIVNNNDNNTIV